MTTRSRFLALAVALLCSGGALLHAQSSDRFDALIGLARVKRDAGDPAGARRYFEQAREVRLFGPAEQAEYFWILTSIDAGAAVRVGIEVLDRSPGDDTVRERSIMLAIARSDEAAVHTLAGAGANHEPGRALWHRRMAESLARLGRYRESAAAYASAVRGRDAEIADRAGLALMLEASGDLTGAREAWSNIPSAERRSRPDWERSRIRAVVRTAPASEAARELTDWLNEWPDDTEARETLVERLAAAGDVDAALMALQRLLDGPRRRHWIAREIDLARASGRPVVAIARLDDVVSGGDATLSDRFTLAELLFGERAFSRAEAVLRAASHVVEGCDSRLFELSDRIPGPAGTALLIEQLDARDCREHPAWLLRGVDRATAEGRHSDALRVLESVSEKHRTGARERRLHGQLRLWAGDAAAAVRLLQPVVAADPDDAGARDALVDALRTQGDAEAAWRVAGPLLDAPDTPESRLEVLAELALEADQPTAVSRILRRVANPDDRDGRHAGLEGRAFLALGQPAAAAERLASVPIEALTTSAALALVDSTFEVRGVNAALETARRVPIRPGALDFVARRLKLELLASDASAAATSRAELTASSLDAPRVVDAEVALAQQRPFDALAILSTIPPGDQVERLADLRVTALAGTGDLQSALAMLQVLRRDRPGFAPFVMREAEFNWRLTPGPDTLAAVLALPARFPGHTGAAITSARALAFERRHADVVSVLGAERGLPLLPLEGRLLMARSLVGMGRDEAALAAVVDHELRGPGAIFRAELIARVQGEESGRRAFEVLAARLDASADTFLGWAALTSDRPDRVDILERAIARFDADPRAWSALAVARAASGDRLRSVEAAERAVSLDRFAADAWFQLLAHSAATRDAAALASLADRFRVVSEDRPALLIGMADRLAGLVRSADDPLLTSALGWLQTSTSDSALLVSRDLAVVRLLAAGERWFEALAAADHAVSAHPESSTAARLRADVLSWAGRHDDAILAYADYLDMVPSDVDARRQQARVAGWAGRFDDASRLYTALRASHSDDAAIAAEARAKGAFFDGRWREAVKRYDEWLQLEPTNGEARFEMAEAQRAAGERELANAALMALSPEGGHRLADAALARDAWQREPSVAGVFEARSANGYGGQRLLELRRSGGGVDLVVGGNGRTTVSAEMMSVLAVAADARRVGYQGGITAAHDIGKSISLEGHASMWDVSGASGAAMQLRSAATWTRDDRWRMAGGVERERLLDNLATIDRGVTATGLFAGAEFQSPHTSMSFRSSWQTLSDGNGRGRLSVSATRAISERLSHVRAVVWSELLDYRRPSATYFAPAAFLRVDGGAEYTHLFSQPRFRGDRMNQIVAGYLVGTDSRGAFYQHPSLRLGWEVSESIALSLRGDVVRSRSYNEKSVVVSMHLIGGAFTR